MRAAVIIVMLAVLGLSVPVGAQESSGMRFYIVPKAAPDANNRIRPKYMIALGLGYSAMDYGLEDTYLLACDPDTAQHQSLAANLDVIAIPPGLDNPVGLTALTTVQQKLEGLHVPAGWVTQTTTYREVLGAVGRMFLLMQRFSAQQLHTFFESGITLDTRINQLTQGQRTALLDAATSLGLDTSGVTGPMTIRQALKLIGDQFQPFELGGETF